MKFVQSIKNEEEKILRSIIKNSPSYLTRSRAHAVLLSASNFKLDQIAQIFDVHRETVSRWVNKWNKLGIMSLFNASKPGRPRNGNGVVAKSHLDWEKSI